jgi:hypothetical protein
MPITLDGTSGLTSPTGTFSGAVQASGVATNLYPLVAATAQASTSGTSVDFTGIPSWVKRITVMLYRMSTNGSSLPVVRVGTSGGIASSGYESVVGYGSVGGAFVVDTAHFGLAPSGAWSAGISYSGLLTITNITGNNWVASLAAASYGSIQVSGGGSVTLGGTLDRVRITTVNGTDTFDAGTINILYE